MLPERHAARSWPEVTIQTLVEHKYEALTVLIGLSLLIYLLITGAAGFPGNNTKIFKRNSQPIGYWMSISVVFSMVIVGIVGYI